MSLVCPDQGVLCLPGSVRRSGNMIGEGRSALQTSARMMLRGMGVICINRLHFKLRNLNGLIRTRFRNLLIWLAPGSLLQYFLVFFFPIWHFSLVCCDEKMRETGLVQIRGFLFGRSGCDRSDQGQLTLSNTSTSHAQGWALH